MSSINNQFILSETKLLSSFAFCYWNSKFIEINRIGRNENEICRNTQTNIEILQPFRNGYKWHLLCNQTSYKSVLLPSVSFPNYFSSTPSKRFCNMSFSRINDSVLALH